MEKNKFVSRILQSLREKLRENGELDVQLHSMNVKEWYSLFEEKTSNISNESIFSDIRYFTLQMNIICYSNLFSGMTKVVKRDPEYEVIF